ncbi:MAG: hypothetical protein GXO94_01060 [Nitrospirae bacterium]|nr:hypothetical protein [Nitrospirota bacterium]
MTRRRYKRYTKRIETEFSSGEMAFKGISSDLSEKGLFIRTNHGFVPGTVVDIDLLLPDGSTSHLRGVVRHTVKSQLKTVKNGMGIEIIESDDNYTRFLREELIGMSSDGQEPSGVRDIQTRAQADGAGIIIKACPACGTKNRFAASKLSLGPKCGKCGSSLT